MADEEVNWSQYFDSIKSVCPWSVGAYKRGELLIVKWKSNCDPIDIPTGIQAVVHLAPMHKPRQLKKMCDRFNQQRQHEEWLWSHPQFGFHSTPIACFIQQDRKTLENARNSAKYTQNR